MSAALGFLFVVGVASAQAGTGSIAEPPAAEAVAPGVMGMLVRVTFLLAALVALGVCVKRRLWDLRSVDDASPAIPPEVLFLIGALSWVCGSMLAGVVFVAMGASAEDPGLGLSALVSGSAQVGSVAVVAIALLWRRSLWAARSGIGVSWARGTLWKSLLAFAVIVPIVIASSAGAHALAELVASMRGVAPPDTVAHETLRKMADPSMLMTAGWWLMALSVIVGAPVVEELIYRGCVQGAVRHATGSHWVAILVSTGVFVVVHVGAVSWQAMIPLAVLSVGMGVAYARTGVIWVPIVVHALFNGMNLLMALAR